MAPCGIAGHSLRLFLTTFESLVLLPFIVRMSFFLSVSSFSPLLTCLFEWQLGIWVSGVFSRVLYPVHELGKSHLRCMLST